MFMSVKERARQIASGQFTASATTAPAALSINFDQNSKPVTDGAPEKIDIAVFSAKNANSLLIAKPSKTSSCKAPATCSGKSAPPRSVSNTPSKPASAPEASETKKTSAKTNKSGDSPSRPSSPRVQKSKSTSTSKEASQTKSPIIPKVAWSKKATSTSNPTIRKTTPTASKNKRSTSPPKRVDSPVEDHGDPLSSLKSDCLKQISGVTGLGGRRLAIVLKQRSSGEWYAALKDSDSGKYLKMWTNRDKTFADKEQALEAYSHFVAKMRNEMRWFPVSPRTSSPKAKA